MKTSQVAAIVLALGSVAVLPSCSGFRSASQSPPPAPATASAAPTTAISPALVRQVQTALHQQGFYNGNVDGVWGQETQSALRQYQSKHNLTANGELDTPTLDAMNLPNNNTSNSASSTDTNGSTSGTNSSTSSSNANPPTYAAPGSGGTPSVSGSGNNPPPNTSGTSSSSNGSNNQ